MKTRAVDARWSATYKVVEDLVTENANHVERLLGGDRVDQNIAVNANKVFRVQNAVFILVIIMLTLAAYSSSFLSKGLCCCMTSSYLTSSVDDLGSIILSLIFDNLAERVFDGGVVAFDKVAVDELDCYGGFACT